MTYVPAPSRYADASFRRCGRSGVDLPAISLGLWQNFGGEDVFETGRAVLRRAFDRGVTHFDLANNYGPPYGSAEANFGRWMELDFRPHRDELVISSKAGWDMWPGPYGNFGSRKYLVASCDASLKRMGLDYVDIFYHHRPDPKTPLEETMGALDHLVRSGKALYVGISSYSPELTRRGPGDPEGHGHADADPPAVLFHGEPLGRRRAPLDARRPRNGLHRVFAAGSGPAHEQVPDGGARGVARRQERLLLARPRDVRKTSSASRLWATSPRHAANPWPRWRSPGCCAIRA